MAKKTMKESVRDQRLKEAERLLGEERIGLGAIVEVMLKSHPNPELVMEKLDQMAEAAVDSKKVSTRAKDAIVYGQRLYGERMKRHLLKQQELLPKDEADQLATPDGGQSSLLSPGELHQDQAAAERDMRQRVLTLYRALGGMDDDELHKVYGQRYGNVSKGRLRAERMALKRQGLLYNREKVWDLREREQATA